MIMKATRYATSRQKACIRCSTAKTKCDRKAGSCTRCDLRGLSCTYAKDLPLGEPKPIVSHNPLITADNKSAPEGLLLHLQQELPAGAGTKDSAPETIHTRVDYSSTALPAKKNTGYYTRKQASPGTTGGLSRQPEKLDFMDLELSCPINAEEISNRWLNSYVSGPEQKSKKYPASITAFTCRILNSWIAKTVRGRGVPPFVHPLQATTKSPLSTCLTLIRICEKPLIGSETVAADVLQREMSNLYDRQEDYDHMNLLAAFQAYLIYSMALFFRLNETTNTVLQQVMMKLQFLASSCSRQGLVCVAEQEYARPRWEAWIIAEAKRRTVFAMYLFDGMLSAQDGLPTSLGVELKGLPAPTNQSSWKACTRHEWEMAFNDHLTDWAGDTLRIDELWPIPEDLDESGVNERRRRVDLWLENVDEFGTMLYAVTSCTHGG